VKEIKQFMVTIGEPQRLFVLIHSTKGKIQDIDMFSQDCAAFCLRLRAEYASCCDVVLPFISALYMILHGLNCLKVHVSNSNKNNSLLLQLLAWPRCAPLDLSEREIPVTLGRKFNTKLLLTLLSAHRLKHVESSTKTLSQIDHNMLFDSFIRLTEQWHVDKVEEERRRQERESTVKVKKVDDEDAAMEEEMRLKEEAELRSMFPDFHQDFAAPVMDSDEVNALVHANPIESETTDAVQALNANQVETFVDSFIAIYSKTDSIMTETNVELRSRLFASSFDAASDLISQVAFYGDPQIDNALLASELYAINSCLRDLKL
jgi:hypothetical protein